MISFYSYRNLVSQVGFFSPLYRKLKLSAVKSSVSYSSCCQLRGSSFMKTRGRNGIGMCQPLCTIRREAFSAHPELTLWRVEASLTRGHCISFASDRFVFLLSAVSVIQSIPVFNETGRFSFTLPYPVKIKVRFSFFLQIYLILLFLGKYWLCKTFSGHFLEGKVK